MDGVFVTLRSDEGSAIIGLVDELSSLRLDPVHMRYELPDGIAHAQFARHVLTEIFRKGYATHGPEGLPFA